MRFTAALEPRCFKGLGDAAYICRADIGHEGHQQPVMALGLEGIVCHGIGLDDHVMLIEHQQRQRYAGEQCFKTLRGTFCHGLAVVQHLVLDFQLVLVIAQLSNQCSNGSVIIQRQPLQVRGVAGLRGGVFAIDKKGEVWAAHRKQRKAGARAQCKRLTFKATKGTRKLVGSTQVSIGHRAGTKEVAVSMHIVNACHRGPVFVGQLALRSGLCAAVGV